MRDVAPVTKGMFSTLCQLSPEAAGKLVQAARLYQDALWFVEVEPQLSWLLLVGAVEAVAGEGELRGEDAVFEMYKFNSQLKEALKSSPPETIQNVANALRNLMGATKKFTEFTMNYLPPPPSSRPQVSLLNWEDRDAMQVAIRKIYDLRSKALHAGIPFPPAICEPPGAIDEGAPPIERPIESSRTMFETTWTTEDMPMHLHVFEYIVRNALLSWWQRQANVQVQV